QVHRPAFASREILRLLRYRHRLVQMRTRCKNSLQALAFSAGSAKRATMLSQKGRERLLQLPMSGAMDRQRGEWLSLVATFAERINRVCENSEAVRTEHGSFAFTLKVYLVISCAATTRRQFMSPPQLTFRLR
ncbi:MAG: hypothetical protein M3R15_11700, partial [Acidobacteriota bacterium]|nr:hypothetical protein [Acidobacteriota bacterium]